MSWRHRELIAGLGSRIETLLAAVPPAQRDAMRESLLAAKRKTAGKQLTSRSDGASFHRAAFNGCPVFVQRCWTPGSSVVGIR